jgi:predicted nucleic acid-binding Zn ribbon protein
LTLDEKIAEANRLGMSYGQFKAMLFEKNGYKPEPKPEPKPREGVRYCEVCGIELNPDVARTTKTCSKSCSYELNKQRTREYYRANRKFAATESVECAFCGGEFLPSRKVQRFCGPECRERYKAAARRGIEMPTSSTSGMAARSYGEGTCLVCGVKYTKRSPGQMACSKACSDRRIAERRRQKCSITLT